MHNGSAKWASMTEGQTKKCLTLIYNLKDRGLLVMNMELTVLKRLTEYICQILPMTSGAPGTQSPNTICEDTAYFLKTYSLIPRKHPHCSDISEL